MDQSCFRERIWKTEANTWYYGKKIVFQPFSDRGIKLNIKVKDKHERQKNSFKVLNDRYKVLSEYDQTIDIMNEA